MKGDFGGFFGRGVRTAAQCSLEFARKCVLQQLPDRLAFLVYPNQSYEGQPRVGDEVVFSHESVPNGQYHGPWSADDVVDFLWREGKVPEWIDIAVESVDDKQTFLGLFCCGRFTGTEELLYYRHQPISTSTQSNTVRNQEPAVSSRLGQRRNVGQVRPQTARIVIARTNVTGHPASTQACDS